MSTKAKSKSVKKPVKVTAEFVYRVKKPFKAGVRAECTKAIGKGATITQVAKKLKVERSKAQNLVRWLAWNGYVTKGDRAA